MKYLILLGLVFSGCGDTEKVIEKETITCVKLNHYQQICKRSNYCYIHEKDGEEISADCSYHNDFM